MPQEPVSSKDGAGPCEELKISFRNGPQNSFGKRKKIVRFCPLWDGCDIYSVPGAWQWDQGRLGECRCEKSPDSNGPKSAQKDGIRCQHPSAFVDLFHTLEPMD